MENQKLCCYGHYMTRTLIHMKNCFKYSQADLVLQQDKKMNYDVNITNRRTYNHNCFGGR